MFLKSLKVQEDTTVSAAEIEVSKVQCQGLGFVRRQVSVFLTGKPVSCGRSARQERNSREAVRYGIANKLGLTVRIGTLCLAGWHRIPRCFQQSASSFSHLHAKNFGRLGAFCSWRRPRKLSMATENKEKNQWLSKISKSVTQGRTGRGVYCFRYSPAWF